MDYREDQIEAMRAILFDWGNLSRGDIHSIRLMVREPGRIETIAGQPHARFWQNVVVLGWAEQIYSVFEPEDVGFEPVSFQLLKYGELRLARFLIAFDLMNMGVCTPASDGGPVPNGYRDTKLDQSKPDQPAVRDSSSRRPIVDVQLAYGIFRESRALQVLVAVKIVVLAYALTQMIYIDLLISS